MAEEAADEQAEEAAGEEAEGEASIPPASSGSRVNQFIVLALIVLIGQGAIAYVLVNRAKGVLEDRQEATSDEKGKKAKEEPVEREEIPIETPFLHSFEEAILVNPVDDDALRFLNAKIILRLASQEVLIRMQEDRVIASKVRSRITQTLNNTHFYHMDEAEERNKLREILKQQINAPDLLNEQVEAVYFQQFILH